MDAGAVELESSKVACEGNNHAAGCSLEVSTIHLVDTIIHDLRVHKSHHLCSSRINLDGPHQTFTTHPGKIHLYQRFFHRTLSSR
jgi:hypothetical protein